MTRTDDPRQLVAIVAMGVSGSIILALLPLLVGLFVDRSHFPIEAAGQLASIRMAGATMGSIIVIFATRRLDWRVAGSASLLFILAGNAASLMVSTEQALGMTQFVTGLGEGGTTLVGAAIASTYNPERNYGILGAASLTLGTIAYSVAPPLAEHYGLAGLVGPMMLLPLFALAMLRWFPYSGEGDIDRSMPQPKLTDPRAIMAVGAMAAFYLGLAAVWSCIERMGIGLGRTQVEVGQAIGLLNLTFGMVGSGASILLGNRYGQRWPSIVALAIGALGFAFAGFGTWSTFLLAIAMIVTGWMAAFSYLMAVLATLDRSGLLAVVGLVAQTACFAAGPWAGTRLLLGGSPALVLFALSCAALAAVLIFLCTRPRRANARTS